jgi:hypothetical protein
MVAGPPREILQGGTKVFRVKNHDFMPKNHIFPNFRGGCVPGAHPPLNPPLSDPGLLDRSDDSKKFSLFIMKTFPRILFLIL